MTKTILMGVSVLALLAALPALAAEETKVKAEASTGAKVEAKLDQAGEAIEKAADKTGAAISKAADKTEAAAKNTYNDVKTYFTDDNDIKATSSVNVATSNTAEALLGTRVQGANGNDVGEVYDIIVSKDGDAEWVIIEDGGIFGLGGKLAAFDYDVIEGFNKDKDVVVKLNEASVKAAKSFEYTPTSGQYSLKKILDADVIGPDGKKIADVDTVAFDGDDAEFVIVAFDKIMGMGGDKAALNFDALELTEAKDKYTFKLNSQQTAQFENYKETTKSN